MWDWTEETQILKKTSGQFYNKSTEHVSDITSSGRYLLCEVEIYKKNPYSQKSNL